MSFIWKLAWRDSRFSRWQLLLYTLTSVLGVAGMVATNSLLSTLEHAINTESKNLLGADLVIRSANHIPLDVWQYIGALPGERCSEQTFRTMLTFPKGDAGKRSVDLRCIDAAFPFYGEFATSPPEAAERLRRGEKVAVLEERLAREEKVEIGDVLEIGEEQYSVAGFLRKAPEDNLISVRFRLPRIIVPRARVAVSQAHKWSTAHRYAVALKLPPEEDVRALVQEMRLMFRSHNLTFDTVDRRRLLALREIRQAKDYLGLASFIALLFGAVGMGGTVRAYLRGKASSIAILRCLGCSLAPCFGVYLLQTLSLSAVGTLIGSIAGIGLQKIIPQVFGDLLITDGVFRIGWSGVAVGAATGFVLCTLFSVLPLLDIRQATPMCALQGVNESRESKPDVARIIVATVIVIAVFLLTLLQTRHLPRTVQFVGGLAIVVLMLLGCTQGVYALARQLAQRGLPYLYRYGVANLHRPGNRTGLLLLSMGMGVALLGTVLLARLTLMRQIGGSAPERQANIVLTNIDASQHDRVRTITREVGAQLVDDVPAVAVTLLGRDAPTNSSSTTPGLAPEEYRAALRSALAPNEYLWNGSMLTQNSAGSSLVPIAVSVEFARKAKLNVGDRLTWEVSGVPIATTLTAIYKADWTTPANFPVIFPANAIDGAPATHVFTVRADGVAAVRLQKQLTIAAPAVVLVDLGEIVKTFELLASKVTKVLSLVGLFSFVTAIGMLVFTLMSNRAQLIRESALLRAIGASRRQIAIIQYTEQVTLGLVAALAGCLLATAANILLARFVYETQPAFSVPLLALLSGGVVMSTVFTGYLANAKVVNTSPLRALCPEC